MKLSTCIPYNNLKEKVSSYLYHRVPFDGKLGLKIKISFSKSLRNIQSLHLYYVFIKMALFGRGLHFNKVTFLSDIFFYLNNHLKLGPDYSLSKW